jgi:hypothetical protein
MQRHEIPTHLSVADKAFAGLTMRQLMTAAIGLALAYGAAIDLPLAQTPRYLAAGLVVVATALLALWRPASRPLEDWAFVLLRYWIVPRVAVWAPRESGSRGEEGRTRYEVLLPEPAWATEIARQWSG